MSSYSTKKDGGKKQTNPLWRGVGCIIMIVIPLIAGGASYFLFNNGTFLALDFVRRLTVAIPDTTQQIIILTIILSILLYTLGTIVYGIAFSGGSSKLDPIEEEAKEMEMEARKEKRSRRAKRKGRR